MRGAQLFFSVKSLSVVPVALQLADQLLLLVADARVDRQPIAERPRVLHEEVDVVLPRLRAPR